MENEWKLVEFEKPPIGKIVKTKISDMQGVRNETQLYLSDTPAQLWFNDSGDYMYYRPTHWRELTADEKQALLSKLTEKQAKERDTFMKRYAK